MLPWLKGGGNKEGGWLNKGGEEKEVGSRLMQVGWERVVVGGWVRGGAYREGCREALGKVKAGKRWVVVEGEKVGGRKGGGGEWGPKEDEKVRGLMEGLWGEEEEEEEEEGGREEEMGRWHKAVGVFRLDHE